MSDRPPTDRELLYAATARCRCGAGLAYPLEHDAAVRLRAWACSASLKKQALEGEHDAYDWAFYKIREETSIQNVGGMTTRPTGTVCKTVGVATCPKCQHKWEGEPYVACGLGHHWFSGSCPKCGYSIGGQGSYSSNDGGPPIDVRYRDVVFDDGERSTKSPPQKGGEP